MGFLDKIKEQASSLSGQLDQALDSTKQKSSINSMRKKRGDMVAQLGESLLEQFRQGEVKAEDLRPQVDQIFDVEREIIDLENSIEAQKQAAAQAKAPQAQTPQAPQAQAAPPPPPPGATQAAPAAPTPAGAAVCSSCGSEIPAGSTFCPNCGAKSE